MRRSFLSTICCIAVCTVLAQGNAFAVTGAFAEHYNAGQNFLTQNQFSSAIVEFRKALRINYLDNSARIGIVNSYLARATHYANIEKNYNKAANDFRSALFYLKMYPEDERDIQNSIGMIQSATSNLNQCLKVMSFDTTPTSRYKKAEELRAIANFPAASYEFSKAAESEKYSAEANAQIGDLMKLLGNDKRSADYYKLSLDKNPNDGVTKMKYARTLDKIGQYDTAVSQYNDALANAKGDMEVLYALERIYLKKLAQTPNDADLNANIGAIKQAQGDLDSALSYYGKAERLNPNSTLTRINVGTLYQQKKDYRRAIEAYDSVLTIEPGNAKAMFYKAKALAEMGDKQTALTLYKSVLTLEPQNIEAKNAITEIVKASMSPIEYIGYLEKEGSLNELYDYSYKLHKEGKIDEAIQGYRAYVSKDQTKADAYVNLAICYAAKDNYGSAITTLNVAKDKFPTNNLVLKTLKEVQGDYSSTILSEAAKSYEAKDYKKAISKYLEIKPETETTMLGVAASYQALNDYDNAIIYYKKAEAINPKNPEIPYYIGYLYSEQQKWNEAEAYLKKAVTLNPESEAKQLLSYVSQNGTLGVLNLGIELYEKKDFAGALAKFGEVLKKESNNAYAYYYRGLIYDEQKQSKLAISDYLNVLKNSKDFPIANYMAAVDYDGLENYKEAFKYYKKFIAEYSTEDEYLKYAKDRIKELEPFAK